MKFRYKLLSGFTAIALLSGIFSTTNKENYRGNLCYEETAWGLRKKITETKPYGTTQYFFFPFSDNVFRVRDNGVLFTDLRFWDEEEQRAMEKYEKRALRLLDRF